MSEFATEFASDQPTGAELNLILHTMHNHPHHALLTHFLTYWDVHVQATITS